MRSFLLIGFLAALCHRAHGAEIHDTVRQAYGDHPLSVVHSVGDGDETSVGLDYPPSAEAESWRFDLLNTAEAIITPLHSDRTLICEVGSTCRLDPEGHKQVYRVTPIEAGSHIFTFQDTSSGLYVTQISDRNLALAQLTPETSYFELNAIKEDDTPADL